MRLHVLTFLTLLMLWSLSACQSAKKRSDVPESEVVQTSTPEAKEQGVKQSVHEFSVLDIEGNEVALSDFAGKKLLIVNVASECGFTSQYEDLQSIHEQMEGRLVVLGFPANDFGGQEPGTNEEIKAFCQSKFQVTFPMFSKISVVGKDQHPLYSWLSTKVKNGWNDEAPKWNFTKYLIDEEGQLMAYYPSSTNPIEIMNQINQDEID